jgi:flavin-dependent dehydrogenase
MLLAQKGYSVLLVDRASFPSDTVSTHFIWQAGVAYLKRWGLLDAVAASNCPPVRKVRFDTGDVLLEGSPPPTVDGVADAYGPRRKILDSILIEAAVAAGAEFRDGFWVRELIEEDGRVVGLRGSTKDGPMATERARIVIGADGARSSIARIVGAEKYNVSKPLCASYYTYWSGVECDAFEMVARNGWGMGALPTNDGLTCVVVGFTESQFPGYRSDVAGAYLRSLELCPRFYERICSGQREDRILGIVETQSFFRKPYGSGWALVGDAGYYRHPLPAQGITDAFRDATLLADAIHEGFSGERAMEQALQRYEHTRNDAVLPMFESTCQRATLNPFPPHLIQFFRALEGNQEETDRFFGTDAGTVPLQEFFSRENIERIMAGAVMAT